MRAGDFEDSERVLMSAQRLSRKRRSLRSSSSVAPAAAVRTMKPPDGVALLGEEDFFEAAAFAVGLDLAGDAGVVDGGHEDQEAAGERDVRGDARALLGDGLLGDLDEDLLAGLQQVADGGQVGGLHGLTAACRCARGRLRLRCCGCGRGRGHRGVRHDGHRGGRHGEDGCGHDRDRLRERVQRESRCSRGRWRVVCSAAGS